ncbi:hypothetical protein N7492_009799 [Penicillium capsulatum]|uniref:BED-type domain-containing protein n=1 Tax=Penicillium capsulatum TaxID=69766 RepID=A0A9W9HS49_9EURO|nr:hypothetical protein N7492_009799 [Penicillium capsulatum]
MSQSQHSDFVSSLYDDEIDNLSYLTSSNHLVTPSGSQYTLNAPDQDFLRPNVPLAAPSSFICVGPDRRKAFILYDRMAYSDWVDWWLQTDFGRKSKINWDSTRYAEIWSNYHQVAHSADGAPKVMCQRCGAILKHPYTVKSKTNSKIQYHSTSTMQRHLKTAGCLKSERGKRAEITRFLKKGVYSYILEEDILKFLILNRLPLHLIEHPTFQWLISRARCSPSLPIIPSANTIRRRLRSLVQDRQERTLRTLPIGSKISIVLDCWTSPFSQAFIAITGYFIDADWVYREVLLRFKPLYRAHTGVNLGSIVLQTLTEHNLESRVFGLTTDNTSSNKTLVDSLQQALSDGVIITRIPCLAHVIQLSLNQLLDRSKAVPLNDLAETKWTEKQSRLAQANAQHREHRISYTLNKVRYLAIYVNASPQRRETFYNLQASGVKLVPIQDVRTRWNSTFLMLRRAKRLRGIFAPFCTEYDCEEMLLQDEEWRQVDYLLCITEPFYDYTTQLSKTRDITAHYMFKIYNKLFEHLEQSMKQLRRKRAPWKQQILHTLEAGRTKLDEYYSQTDNIQGHIYARDTYRKSFQQALIPYQEQLSTLNQSLDRSHSAARLSSKLDKILDESEILFILRLLRSGESTKHAFQQSLPLRGMHSPSLQQVRELNGSLTLLGISVIIVEGE